MPCCYNYTIITVVTFVCTVPGIHLESRSTLPLFDLHASYCQATIILWLCPWGCIGTVHVNVHYNFIGLLHIVVNHGHDVQ